jgi:hypothetical protein
MFLKKLAENRDITIDYHANGTVQTLKGRISKLNLREQILFLKDQKQKIYPIRLSGIVKIH